jgi:hypothetical protein
MQIFLSGLFTPALLIPHFENGAGIPWLHMHNAQNVMKSFTMFVSRSRKLYPILKLSILRCSITGTFNRIISTGHRWKK